MTLLDETLANARAALLTRRQCLTHWEGHLSSSALATATAVLALDGVDHAGGASARYTDLICAGLAWLASHQNTDGGWGDTPASRSNISTTMLCWAAQTADRQRRHEATGRAAEGWLVRAAGSLEPRALANAIRDRYGRDRTFSAPILTAAALAGRLGHDGWALVPSLPFELAVLPHQVFGSLRLPVVSYALPALIAIGQVRHRLGPRSGFWRAALRDRAEAPTLRVLDGIQPASGGFLEATPLTSFVVMSLAAIGQVDHPVVTRGVSFLAASVREDGSWPIDTNLATWVTTLSINALAAGGTLAALSTDDRQRTLDWIAAQQYRVEHPYTHAAPGGWAWTPLAGGVPDADDTAGALLALGHLTRHADASSSRGPAHAAVGGDDPAAIQAAARAALGWLLALQNRDGGIPTFCRGWGYLPFDRSGADLTAHAIRAWQAWRARVPSLARTIDNATARAVRYLAAAARPDGAWEALWFGNEHAPGETNLTYGTARVVMALAAVGPAPAGRLAASGANWLLAAQHADGGWGAAAGIPSSIEETALAVEALALLSEADWSGVADGLGAPRTSAAIQRGVAWLAARTDGGRAFPASPIGLYFARLWYSEELYPLIFTVAALGRARRVLSPSRPTVSSST